MSAIRKLMRIFTVKFDRRSLPQKFFPVDSSSLRTIALGMLSLCTSCNSVATAHYKVTAYVKDGTLLRKGSGVWSVNVWRPLVPLITPYSSSIHGQAIPVSLQEKGYLFLIPADELSTSDSAPWAIFNMLFSGVGGYTGSNNIDFVRNVSKMKGLTFRAACDYDQNPLTDVERREIPLDSPRLAAEAQCLRLGFTQTPSDASAFKVISRKDLRTLPGGPVRILAVDITITDEPVTIGIERILPWLGPVTDQDQYSPKNTPPNDRYNLRR